MTAWLVVFVGVILAVAIAAGSSRLPGSLKAAGGLAALLVLFLFVAMSSIRHVGQDEIGLVSKNFGRNLPQGRIIATQGEKGPQAKILGPGWHFWLWPGLYDIDIEPVVEVKADEVGLITAVDGRPLPDGEAFAPQWEDQSNMLIAESFLGEGGGTKGPQASVLRPGKYRINTKLFKIEKDRVTNIEKAMVGVIKSNVGLPPEGAELGELKVVEKGQRGIWREVLRPQKVYLNTKAYEVTDISTKQQIVRYGIRSQDEELSEISVRTSDGFTFPVDVRVEYQIKENDAPLVVAQFGDDSDLLLRRLTSTVRAIFRNNAETVKALDYVNARAQQETTSTDLLSQEMAAAGVTIIAVRIGQIGDVESLGQLLQTQTDREIATEEQKTFQVQQLAAEQKKELTRTEQEAEEEKRLATARYEVQIAEQNKEKKIIEAGAEAEAIEIRAQAQADAYRMIAEEIGPGNAALIELLKIVGESGINITPRVMVVGEGNGSGGAASDSQTTALIGTMLDTMTREQPPSPPSTENDRNRDADG